jgi:putative membrane protein insertion efficiency factor
VTMLLVWLVRAYRAALVPFFGPCCRFLPSCSQYAEDALHTHGWWRGGALTLYRLGRCHPFARGGLDPVPPVSQPRRVRIFQLGAARPGANGIGTRGAGAHQ